MSETTFKDIMRELAEAFVEDTRTEEGLVIAESGLETRIRSGQWHWYERIGQALCAAVVAQVEAGREAEVSK